MSLHLKYRRDIDGLRAVAVVAVVAFHAFPMAIPGGFVGVDIFFVISGFLITGILIRNFEAGTFTYKDFYSRRVKRIFPALLVVLLTTLCLGWFVLLRGEFHELETHIVAGIAFVSNFVLWKESGYFDKSSALKPLLHLWSLSVEEQFYLVWPLIIALSARRRQLSLLFVSAAGAISFAIDLYLTTHHPSAAYYLLPARGWELMMGGALAWISHYHSEVLRKGGNLRSFAGAILLVLALWLIHESLPFPGWWALLPVIGATLLISGGEDAWVNRRMLALQPVVAIGLISYPWYLWHWPLLSMLNIVFPGRVTAGMRIGAVLLSLLLAWLTYILIERRFKKGSLRLALQPAFAMLALLIVVSVALRLHVAPRIHSAEVDRMLAATTDWSYPGRLRPVTWHQLRGYEHTGTGKDTVVFLGDSHMEQYAPRIEELYEQVPDPPRVLFLTSGGCPPIPGLGDFHHGDCLDMQRAIKNVLQDPSVKTVVVAAAWSIYLRAHHVRCEEDPNRYYIASGGVLHYFCNDAQASGLAVGALQAFLTQLSRSKRVIFVLDNQSGEQTDPYWYLRGSRFGDFKPSPEPQTIPLQQDQAEVRSILLAAGAKAGVTVVDPMSTLCAAGQCRIALADGTPIYMDSNHLRASYVAKHATYLSSSLLGEDRLSESTGH